MITLCFKVDPVAKGRPRFWNGRAVTPKKTRDFEKLIKTLAKQEYRADPLEGPLSMHVVFYIKRPKTVKREFPTIRPDLTNMVKSLEDSLNGVVYIDDSQIVDMSIHKRYSDQAQIIVTISNPIDGVRKLSF